MGAPEHRHERRWFGRGRTRALLSAGLLVGIGAVGTSAYWRDTGKATGVSFSTGAINIDLDTTTPTKPESYNWSAMSGSLPISGGSQAKVIRVRNNSSGRLSFTYTITGSATNNTLGNALKVRIVRNGTVSGSTCTGADVIASTVAVTSLSTTDIGPVSSTSATPYHDLCFELSLPSGSGATNGNTATVSFSFSAKQVIP